MFLSKFPAVGKRIINRFEKSADDNYLEKSGIAPKKKYQVFQLIDVETGRPIIVANGDTTFGM